MDSIHQVIIIADDVKGSYYETYFPFKSCDLQDLDEFIESC